jgi:hypothetical protein
MTSVSSDRRQGLNSSAAIKVPCDVATTVALVYPFTGLQTIDGVVLATDDRVLVKNQTDQTQNGIWAVDTGTWSRALDFDGAYDALEGTIITVIHGNTNASTLWKISTPSPTIGGALSFLQSSLSPSDSNNVQFLQAGAGAGVRTMQSKERDIVSVLDFYANGSSGAMVDPTGAVDSTAGIQKALDAGGAGSCVYVPNGTYYIDGTLSMYAGQYLIGDGWWHQTGSWTPLAGSILVQHSVADIPLIQCVGASDNVQKPNGGMARIALQSNVPNSTVGIGYYAAYARKIQMDDVYITGFNIGIDQDPQCWQWHVNHCIVSDFHTAGMRTTSSSEDNLFTNVQLSGYDTNAIGIYMRNQCANNTFINCYVSAVKNAVVMAQGDSNGDGTGTPFPMHSVFVGCLIEDTIQTAFTLIASAESAANSGHPGLTLLHLRAFNGGAWSTPNTGQSIVYAAHSSQINVQGVYSAGYDYGASLGTNSYGFVPTGSKVGPMMWGMDHNSSYATSRIQGYTANISFLQGEKAIAKLQSAALNYTASNFTRVPFTTVSSDFWGWASAANQGWIPLRNQNVRFSCKLHTASAPIGRYVVLLYKNGSNFATLYDSYVSTAGNPLLFGGEFVDVPNGSTDTYWIVAFTDIANFTLDTAQTWANAEVVGN